MHPSGSERHIVPEVAVVLREGIMEIDGIRRFLRPPGMVLIPPDLPHCEGAVTSNRPYTSLWLNGGGEILMALISRYRPGQGWDVPWKTVLGGALVQRLLLPLEAADVATGLRLDDTRFSIFQADLLAVLVEFHRTVVRSCAESDSNRPPRMPLHANTLDHVRFFLSSNLHRPLTVSDAARLTRLTPRYLNRRFHQRYGEPIHAFLDRIRMEKAMGLLQNTNLLVKEIAEKVGYADSLYFSRCFHRRFGYAPSDVPRAQADTVTVHPHEKQNAKGSLP